MNKAFPALVILFLFSLLTLSCEKERMASESQSTSAHENAFATELISSHFLEFSRFVTENKEIFHISANNFQIKSAENNISSCIAVSILPQDNSWPKTMTVNFGDGCTAGNMTRKGKMIAVLSDRFENAGAHITLTFENFEINGRKIEGTQIITNKGRNAEGMINYTHEISSFKISSPDKTISISATNSIEWIEGSETLAPADDVFSITGRSSGIDSGGQDFTSEIISPLIRRVSCAYFVSGCSSIKSGTGEMTMDYGSGECDDKAIINTAGEIKEVTLATR